MNMPPTHTHPHRYSHPGHRNFTEAGTLFMHCNKCCHMTPPVLTERTCETLPQFLFKCAICLHVLVFLGYVLSQNKLQKILKAGRFGSTTVGVYFLISLLGYLRNQSPIHESFAFGNIPDFDILTKTYLCYFRNYAEMSTLNCALMWWHY